MKPRILISDYPRRVETVLGATPLHTVTAWYPESVACAGGLPLVLPAAPDVDLEAALDLADGVVLTGGGDVDPARYGAERHPETGNVDAGRDTYDLRLAEAALARRLPLLAICRGLQVLNVAAGGTLVQHVPAATGAPHQHLERFDVPAHDVRIDPDSRLAAIVGATQLAVNSLHHQAVDRPGAGLRPVAWAPDGTIEALEAEDPSVPALGLQWHPELTPHDAASAAVFRAFVGDAAAVVSAR